MWPVLHRFAGRAKLKTAFESLQQGVSAALAEGYPLPDDLDIVVKVLLDSLTMPSVPSIE